MLHVSLLSVNREKEQAHRAQRRLSAATSHTHQFARQPSAVDRFRTTSSMLDRSLTNRSSSRRQTLCRLFLGPIKIPFSLFRGVADTRGAARSHSRPCLCRHRQR
ncbi:hypothetical protein BDP81DRAFT_61742 [Colletotrichum phormii]|uniref:Uncharacterized protein n=1 Tax=Colletotrichum phormii TaxID=359342 RepID=A0AAJ0ECB6_9PEZI|nr:uncharacterized protein BDP81DRAFT_61742 [Colletotrichum phormii]KAK1633834.1 hypothetical protein BDP81DRAFT_61742 [Colletotrichum phormii]